MVSKRPLYLTHCFSPPCPALPCFDIAFRLRLAYLIIIAHCFFLCFPLLPDSDDDGESEAAKQLIQPIAEKIIAKYKAKDEETPLLFFVAGEVQFGGGGEKVDGGWWGEGSLHG